MQQTSRTFAAASFAALLALSACNSEPNTITADEIADPQAEDLANAAPVELPPSIVASRTYRCKDNSLLYAEFLSDDSVRVRAERGATPTVLTAPEGTPPYVAEGYSLSANADSVSYTAPGKGTQSCNA